MHEYFNSHNDVGTQMLTRIVISAVEISFGKTEKKQPTTIIETIRTNNEEVQVTIITCETKTLKEWLESEPELLNEVTYKYNTEPEWWGINPEVTPVFFRNKEEVDAIRAKPGESGGHHPHGLALGGPEGQKLTPTGDKKEKGGINPKHVEATSLQRRVIRKIKIM
jgi:hypothetical protein